MSSTNRTIWLLVAFALSITANAVAQARDARALADEYLAAHLARYPESNSADQGGLFDNSLAALRSWKQREARFLERVRRIEPTLEPGSPESRTLALLRERLEMSQQFALCRRELWNVSPLTGWLNEYRGYAARQPVGSPQAREATLRRWRTLPTFIDREIANLRTGLRTGYSASQQLVVATIAQADQVIASPVNESPFYLPALQDSAPSFRAAVERVVQDRIAPALRRYRDFLANEYLPRARSSVGLAALPNGAACFRALVRRYTTLDTATQALEAIGRDLLAGADVEAIRARQRMLLADSANQFRSSREALTSMTDALRRAAAAAPRWFRRVPSPLVPVVDSMPDAGSVDPDALYVPGNGTAPPRVYVNVPRVLEPGGRLYAERLAFHEGIPGHHFQISLQQTADVHPLDRLLWNAGWGEGWAVYASNLADEMGLYSSEAARSGVVTARLDDGLTFRVQYGLHVLGWTREQAIDTMVHYSAGSPNEAERQVDYFLAAPAHALAYPVGARYIATLRRAAAQRLGAAFDVRRFHDLLLESGALPLSVVRRMVDRWVDAELLRGR